MQHALPERCPTGYTIWGFDQSNGRTCEACQSHCNICSSRDTCTQCRDSKYLNNHGDCVSTCPSGYTGIGSGVNGRTCQACLGDCDQCKSSGTCTQCLNSNYLNNNGVCVSTCPSGFTGIGSTVTARTCEANVACNAFTVQTRISTRVSMSSVWALLPLHVARPLAARIKTRVTLLDAPPTSSTRAKTRHARESHSHRVTLALAARTKPLVRASPLAMEARLSTREAAYCAVKRKHVRFLGLLQGTRLLQQLLLLRRSQARPQGQHGVLGKRTLMRCRYLLRACETNCGQCTSDGTCTQCSNSMYLNNDDDCVRTSMRRLQPYHM